MCFIMSRSCYLKNWTGNSLSFFLIFPFLCLKCQIWMIINFNKSYRIWNPFCSLNFYNRFRLLYKLYFFGASWGRLESLHHNQRKFEKASSNIPNIPLSFPVSIEKERRERERVKHFFKSLFESFHKSRQALH